MEPVFAKAPYGVVIVDTDFRVVVSETREGRVYLHVTRRTCPAPGLRPDDAIGAGRLVELYYALWGKSRPESPPFVLNWAAWAIRADFRLSFTGEWEPVPGECHEFLVPADAVVDWYPGVLPEVPDYYTVFAWYSPATRTNILYYVHDIALDTPPAHVVVRAAENPEDLWERIGPSVKALFNVKALLFEKRILSPREIYNQCARRLERRGRTVRIGCTAARIVPVSGELAERVHEVLNRRATEYRGIEYIIDRGVVLARRRGTYVGRIIED